MTWEGYYWTACGYAVGMWMALHIDWPAHLPWWGCALFGIAWACQLWVIEWVLGRVKRLLGTA